MSHITLPLGDILIYYIWVLTNEKIQLMTVGTNTYDLMTTKSYVLIPTLVHKGSQVTIVPLDFQIAILLAENKGKEGSR